MRGLLIILLRYTFFIKEQRVKTYFVVPIYSKWIKGEIPEISQVLQLCQNASIENCRKVKKSCFTITEGQAQYIIAHISSFRNS